MATICLAMMVKNEEHVVSRALRSVAPLIDYWVVTDTGSTDNTPGVVLESLSGIPGELHSVPWVSFGHNRTRIAELAASHADYTLFMDADMTAHFETADFKSALAADAYHIHYQGALDYAQPMLVASRHPWRFIGATHEYIHADGAHDQRDLRALSLRHHADGGMRADKFERDALLLERELAETPDAPRPTFYLAQTYRDLGRLEEALQWYRARADLTTGWDEEQWYAQYQVGAVLAQLGAPLDEVTSACLRAWQTRPTRMEPLQVLARTCRDRGAFAQGRLFASPARSGVAYPTDWLFVESTVYHWQLLLEYALCSAATGALTEATRAFHVLLDRHDLPDRIADMAIRGRDQCHALLRPPSAAPSVSSAVPPTRFMVFVPFHNPGHLLDDCVMSLLAQDYPHVRFVFVDDASTDNSARSVPIDDPRVQLIRNAERRGVAFNLHQVLADWPDEDDVVVCVDGDDALAVPDALSELDRVYRSYGCWVSYGQYRHGDGTYGHCRPFAEASDFDGMRQTWWSSHLRTFRAGLFRRMADADPDYACLKDADGAWLTSAVDVALMYPLMEMAGWDRVCFVSRVLYVYHSQHAGNIHRTRRAEQLANCELVQRKARWVTIDDYRQGGA